MAVCRGFSKRGAANGLDSFRKSVDLYCSVTFQPMVCTISQNVFILVYHSTFILGGISNTWVN